LTLVRLCRLAILLLVLPFNAKLAHATEPYELTFAVNTPGSFPYLYYDDLSQTYKGLVPEFFAALKRRELLDVTFVDSNQQRSETFVKEGKVDLYLANLGWVSEPNKVITSIPIIQHKTFLYSLTPFDNDFDFASVENKRVCTQLGYAYTGLQAYFEAGKLVRFESSTQDTLGLMLAKGRCDYAVLNNYNAKVIFSAPEYCGLTIHQSPKPTSTVPLTIVMRPALHKVKALIDAELTGFITSGKATQSLASHSSIPRFPMQGHCSSG
jgi:ABC-type amino acid transport substrate-binding protein